MRAQFRLGLLYEEGRGVARDYRVATEQYREVAADYLGIDCDTSDPRSFADGVLGNYFIAAQGNRKAAEQGDEYAQFYLGWMYEFGLELKQDYSQALKWYKMLARIGNS